MALKLILGNSGSGKTEYMYKQVVRLAEANPTKNYLVIVPEQFTMATQRKLVDLSTNHAIMNIDVLSFERLAYRVFDEMGVGDLQVLEETGKNLVLRKVAQEQADKLTVLKGNMHRMGYIAEVKSLISELMQYNISPAELEKCLDEDKLPYSLQKKLRDVYVMYKGFAEFLEGHYITAEELLHVLSDMAGESEILKDSVMVLDEFTGFTPVQNELLAKLMPICQDIWVALTIDAKEDFYHSKGMQELFHLPKKTVKTLMELAEKTATPVEEPVVLSGGDKKRFGMAKELYFLEQNLFRPTYKRSLDKPEALELYCGKNPKEELIYAARYINDLVQKQGYRYRDIAVVSGDLEQYTGYVEQVCRQYDIPFFLDATKEVLFHPFIEFIRATLEILRSDFSYHAMMRLLRTGYMNVTEEEIDRLENYLLATGIHGKKQWLNRFLRLPKNGKNYDVEAQEAIRQKLMEGLLPLIEVFDNKHKLKEQIRVLYQYIAALEVEQKLWQRETELLEAGEQAKSKEYGQIYRIVVELLEKCVHVLGEDVLSIKEIEEILDAGFEAAKVAVIPPGFDSVTFGDIERTRLGELKVLLFLGVNEGIVPKSLNQGGIISQYERDTLEAADITLAPGAREQVFIQKFYLYQNMTKPSEKLYISYSRIDNEGKALRPSYLIRTLMRLFPKLQVQELKEAAEVLNTSTKAAAKEYLLAGEKDEVWYALAKCFLESDEPEAKAHMEDILDAFYYHYSHDPISHVVAEAIYGKNIEGSVTRLEKYAQCAYAHFLSYGLKLKEREESGFESVDMGNLYHAAIEIYSKKLKDSSYDWFTIPEELQESYATQSMEEAVLAYPNLSVYATAENAHQAKRMEDIFRKTIWALTAQVRKGSFVPNEFEVAFSKADNLEALEFALEDNNHIRLRGRIDRLDTCVEDNRLYVKIIDYKSGSTKFDLLKIYQGMQLQLVVYMNAAMELEKKKHSLKEVLPAGMFYYHIDDPVIELEGSPSEAEIKEAILKQLKPDGIISSDQQVILAMDGDFEKKSDVIPVEYKKDGSLSAHSSVATEEEFAIMSEYVNQKIVETGNAIYQGNVEVAPLVEGQTGACSFCPYKAVCGFDVKLTGFKERKAMKLDKAAIFEKMETDNARGRK